MTGLIIALAAICAVNAWFGWRWSRLDHNPWMSKPLGGAFSGMSRPGMVPSHLSVEQINARGRLTLYLSPIIFIAGTLLLLTQA